MKIHRPVITDYSNAQHTHETEDQGGPIWPGYSGYSGDSGYSGYSGIGYSGADGASGYSGVGYSGADGASGYSGQSFVGSSGYSGYSSDSGYSGLSGYSSSSGYSGYSGIGTSGYSGIGTSGYSSNSGYSGLSGYSSASGYSGYSGTKPSGQIFLTAAGGWPSTTLGCKPNALYESGTYKENVYTLDFVDGSTTYAEWTVAMPSDWDGLTVTAVFYWMANDTTANAVVWGIQGVSYGDGDALDVTFGTVINVTDANASTAYQIRISAATGAVTIGGTPAAGKLVQFRVERAGGDGNDSLTVDAKLIGVMITFTRS
jgi:hypothetical protein